MKEQIPAVKLTAESEGIVVMRDEMRHTVISPLALLDKALSSGMEPDKLGKLMDLAERWEDRQAEKAFKAALADFQAECPPVQKKRGVSLDRTDRSKIAYTYASYDDVNEVARPIMTKHGFSASFDTKMTDKVGFLTVLCTVSHSAGHSVTSNWDVPIPSMSVNDTQKFGAAVSYAKRYALCGALNIIVTDEDPDAAGLDVLSEGDASTIARMIELCGSSINMNKFLTFAEADEISHIPTRNLRKLTKLLEDKLARIGVQWPEGES